MKIITCAGYYRTGSSAVTDLLSEFDNVGTLGTNEFRLIYDASGIRDLEYGILENNDRLNTSIYIKRFIKFTKILNGGLIRRGYKKFCGSDFWTFTMEYVDKITELKCAAWSHLDRFEKGVLFNVIDVILEQMGFILNNNYRRSLLNLTKECSYYSDIDSEDFFRYTKEYIAKIMRILDKEKKDYFMVDQLLPPENLDHYFQYFSDDIKVIVVDRDPRDLFILENEIYKWGNIPYKNVETYCKWYQITRRHRNTEVYDKDRVMFLRFEDLIYNYNSTLEKISYFLGIDLSFHTVPKTKFDPSISIKGTNLILQYPKYTNSIKYIEDHLQEYIYPFS